MNRPTGITLISNLQFFRGGFGIFVSLAILLFRDNFIQLFMEMLKVIPELSQFSVFTAGLSKESFERLITVVAVIWMVCSLVELLLGYGLSQLKKWAWVCTLGLHTLNILDQLYGIITVLSMQAPTPTSMSQRISQICISAVIVYYLCKPEVKQVFGRQAL